MSRFGRLPRPPNEPSAGLLLRSGQGPLAPWSSHGRSQFQVEAKQALVLGDSAVEDHAVTDVWRDHRAYLVDLAFRMLGNIGDAEDVVQEAFIRYMRADSYAIE